MFTKMGMIPLGALLTLVRAACGFKGWTVVNDMVISKQGGPHWPRSISAKQMSSRNSSYSYASSLFLVIIPQPFYVPSQHNRCSGWDPNFGWHTIFGEEKYYCHLCLKSNERANVLATRSIEWRNMTSWCHNQPGQNGVTRWYHTNCFFKRISLILLANFPCSSTLNCQICLIWQIGRSDSLW